MDHRSKENPYHSPEQASAIGGASPKLLLWTVAVVFGSTILGGLIGLAVGTALGSFVPNYYRSVFSNGNDPEFDPVAVGIGQGLTQGVGLGAVIGLVLVAMFYWYRSRSTRTQLGS